MTLAERADKMESGEIRWVQGLPEFGDACLITGPPGAVTWEEVDLLADVVAWSGTAGRAVASWFFNPTKSAFCARWNDHPDTTLAEVVAVQRAASDLLGES